MITRRYETYLRIFNCISIILLVSGCSNLILMNPKGQIGLEQRSIILTALGLMLVVVVPAIVMAFFFTKKYSSLNYKAKYSPNWSNSSKIEIIIWTVPIIIVTFLAVLTWKSTHFLDPSKPVISKIKPITIQVVAMDWKWLFIYPEQNIATINEIAFPINVPVKFEITSNSVMNSFFIPQLGSQIYAMAGMNSTLYLIANEPGNYKGISANFSGRGFSGMKFTVIATSNKAIFNQWIHAVKISPKAINNMQDYAKITEPSEYHPVQYFSSIKPDLYQDIINKFNSS